jgi:hypothetical protein
VPDALPVSETVSVGVLENEAATDVVPVIVKVHVAEPVQPAPVHPAKKAPAPGMAVSVICVPGWKGAVQAEPQLIPAGLLVIVPLPLTVTNSVGEPAKLAVALALFCMVTWHEPVPLQTPLQPVKVLPDAGLADKVTFVPGANAAVHAVPQLIPLGSLTIEPDPDPPTTTVRVGLELNFAVTMLFEESVTLHVAAPLHAPPQEAK